MSRRATHVTSRGPCPIPERRRLSRVGTGRMIGRASCCTTIRRRLPSAYSAIAYFAVAALLRTSPSCTTSVPCLIPERRATHASWILPHVKKGDSRYESGPVSDSRTTATLASRDRSYDWQGIMLNYGLSSLAISLHCHRPLCRCCAAEDVTELYNELPPTLMLPSHRCCAAEDVTELNNESPLLRC